MPERGNYPALCNILCPATDNILDVVVSENAIQTFIRAFVRTYGYFYKPVTNLLPICYHHLYIKRELLFSEMV